MLVRNTEYSVIAVILLSRSTFLHFRLFVLDKEIKNCYNTVASNDEAVGEPFTYQHDTLVYYRGVAQLVARDVWDVDAAGSNPVTPTKNRGFDRKIKGAVKKQFVKKEQDSSRG